MEFSITRGIRTTISNSVTWLHSHIKQIPVAGPVYTYLNDHIRSPLWNVACKVKDYVTPYFKQTYQFVESKARNYPVIAVVLGVFFASRARRYIYPRNPNARNDTPTGKK